MIPLIKFRYLLKFMLIASFCFAIVNKGISQSHIKTPNNIINNSNTKSVNNYHRYKIISNNKNGNTEYKKKRGVNALWVQGGLGSASADINYSYHPKEFMHFECSFHYRHHHNEIATGKDTEGTDCWEINTLWATYGYNYSMLCLDASVAAGVGYSHWYYHTESEKGTIYSPKELSFIIKAQTIVHLPQILGVGIVFSWNYCKEVAYNSTSFVLVFGGWNW